jgi:hypothetical protein
MASDILGLKSHNFANGTEELIAIWYKTPMIRKNNAWIRSGPSLTPGTKAEMESFLDNVFLVNGTDVNWNYDGSAWSSEKNFYDSPISKYIKRHNARLYLYNIKIGGVSYPSRVWLSDLPKNNQITWGLETGNNLIQTAGEAEVISAGSTFLRNNIKIGDPFTITTGANQGEYTVQSIDSQTQITLTTDLTNTTSGSSFWVGGNWFDVETDDGDIGMGLGVTSNEIFCFKKDSVHRYNSIGNELRQVRNAPGTTSPRSIVTYEDYVYYYHPSGIYRTAGFTEELISSSIYDVIEGVATAFQDDVVSWVNRKKQTINMFLGDVTLRDGDTITNCVATFDVNAKAFSFRSYPLLFRVATPWLSSNVPKIYLGDNSSNVVEIDTGTSFGNSTIPSQLITKVYFPGGSEALVNFDRVRFYLENGQDVQIYYRLYYQPTGVEDQWINNPDWKPMKGSNRGDRSEWRFPMGTRASGIQFKFVESSVDESFFFEKLVIYYSEASNY